MTRKLPKLTDPDPFVPPGCRDTECSYSHDRHSYLTGKDGTPTCPKSLERQRYQFRRWARRHPNYLRDRRATNG